MSIFGGGGLTDSSRTQWAPTTTAHDPNPPIPLEEGGLGWLPSYPDRIEPQPHRGALIAALPFFFYAAISATTPYDPARLDWQARGQTQPVRAVVGLRTDLPAAAAIPPLFSWLPSYPDRLDPRGPHASQQRAYFGPDRAPVVPFDPSTIAGLLARQPDMAPGRPDGRAGWPAFFGTTGALAQLPVPPLSWKATHPDRIDPRASLSAAQQRAYFRPETPLPAAPPLSWLSSFPERIDPPRALHASLQRAASDVPRVTVAYDPAQLDWLSRDPVRPIRFVVGLLTTPPTTAPERRDVSWLSTYPAIVPGRALPVALQRAFFGPDRPIVAAPFDPATGAGFYAVYPSRVDARPGVAQHRAFFKGEFTPAAAPYNPALLDWLGRYDPPLFKRRFRLLTSALATQQEPLPIIVDPVYPSRIDARPGLSAAQQLAYFGPTFVPVSFNPATGAGYFAVYPARIDPRPGLHASQQRAYFRPETPLPAAPLLSWLPTYPDRIDPPKGLGAPWQAFYRSNYVPITFDIRQAAGFLAVYPNWIEPARGLHASQQRAFFRPETPLPAAPPLSWRGVFPERIDPPRALHASQQRPFFGSALVVPGGADPSTFAACLTSAPSSVPRGIDRRHMAPAFFYQPLIVPVVVPPLSWLGTWPTLVRPAAIVFAPACAGPAAIETGVFSIVITPYDVERPTTEPTSLRPTTNALAVERPTTEET